MNDVQPPWETAAVFYVLKNGGAGQAKLVTLVSHRHSPREQRGSSQSPRQLLRLSKEKPRRRTRQTVFFASFALSLLRIRAYSRKASERNPSKNPSPSVTASRLFLLRTRDSRSSPDMLLKIQTHRGCQFIRIRSIHRLYDCYRLNNIKKQRTIVE